MKYEILSRSGWFFRSVTLIFFSSLVLTVVQQFLLQNYEQNSIIEDFLLRFIWNGLFFGLVIFLFPRHLLSVWIFLVMIFQTGTLFYLSYFGSPPSYSILINNTDEGLEVIDSIVSLFPWKLFCLFFVIACLQLFLQRLRDRCCFSWKKRFVYALICLIGIIGLFFGLNRGSRALTSVFVYPLEPKIAKFGLLPVVLREMYFLKEQPLEVFLKNADEQEKNQSNLLEKEYCLPGKPKNIVVIQVESLDYAVMRLKKNGKEVVPFLNNLAQKSLEYRIWAILGYGSATADFVMLNGIPPAKGLFNYNIPGYQFPMSLPVFLKEHGYQTYSVHGVRGSFYNRDRAYTAMKFEHPAFRQKITDDLKQYSAKLQPLLPSKPVSEYGNKSWLEDEVLFAYSRWLLDENQDRNNFIFMITESTHNPFDAHSSKEIIAAEKTLQDKYLNGIHELDQQLQIFYESLPNDTLFMVYGDHTPFFTSGDYVSDIQKGRHYVPLIISVKGRDIHPHQQVETNPKEFTLSLRDAYSYIKKAAAHE